jgi:NTP pyrophosphatase (non-canonical NTP hydrolase)/DNA-directed RNA polymerase subunit RPC12/RpoP
MKKMESTGEHYRCDKCGWKWDHEDDACPNCGSKLYIMMEDESINLQRLQNEIKKWSDSAFGMYRHGVPIIHHLKAETDELIDALETHHKGIYGNSDESALKRYREDKENILMEFADCFMLLIDAASHEQITINMLAEATARKLEINKKRKWGKPNELGYTEHIKE